MPPPTLDQVIFPEQANHTFSKILGDLKRSNLSITNRLRSIQKDARFVGQVSETLKLPLVANERCGSWYIDPGLKTASAYFKSTDGHTGQWKFSTRRLNLHLLELIGSRDGCIIVDSTRRGKRIPDALSKTIPIWCAVLNRALFPSHQASHELFVRPDVVSDSEKNQIESRLPEFLASLEALNLDLPALRRHLKKPLRPFWVTQEDADDLFADAISRIAARFHPVVCCTSSRRVLSTGTEISEGMGYIQGAGDDTENWALGLTAPLFWVHAEALLSTPEADLPELIETLLLDHSNDAESNTGMQDLKEVVSSHIFVGTIPTLHSALASGACVVSIVPETTDPSGWVRSPRHLEVGLGRGKTASRFLRQALPQICEFASRYLTVSDAGPIEPSSDSDSIPRREAEIEPEFGAGPDETSPNDELEVKDTQLLPETENKKAIILCETGKDLSVGVALALSCWCFDDAGNLRRGGDGREGFTKTAIRVKLGHIMTVMPDANPSRATLQSVNSFLMD